MKAVSLRSLILFAAVIFAYPQIANAEPDCAALSLLTLQTPEGDVSIKARMKALDVPGASLALIHDFSIACTAVFGVKSKETLEPVDEETLFQAASISKPIAAVVALKLVSEGVLDLDAPILWTFKGWSPTTAHEDAGPDAITLRQILNHTAGFGTPSFPGYPPGAPLPTTVEILEGAEPANSDPVAMTAPTGQAYAYSGGGYTWLEHILSTQMGAPFEQLVESKILSPLGMGDSTFAQPLPDERIDAIAMGYADIFDPSVGGFHVYPELAAAGLWTNAKELSQFVIALQRSLQEQQVQDRLLPSGLAQDMITPFDGTMSGMGIVVDEMYITHGGHNRGYMSRFLSHDRDGYGFVILTNAEQPRFISEVINSIGQTYGWEDF